MAEAPARATAQPSSWNLVEEVAARSGLIADCAAEGRARRQVSDEVVQALKDAGFMRAVLPKRWGGLEATPQEFFAALLKVAEQDMSSAWIAGIIAVHAYQLALMDDQAQADVYADDPDTLISSSYNPVGGRAESCDGGFRLSGRWGWSSGSAHCSWVLLGAIVPGDGYRTFLVPRPDYEIEDTWFVYGLQGTGSNDIVIDEPVFVPEHRTHRQMDGFNCVHGQANPMYSIPWAQVFIRVVSTPAIGAARHAVDLFVTNAAASSTDPTKLQGDPDITRRVAEGINDIDEVETIMFRNFDRMMERVNAGQAIPMIDRVRYRYQASLVIDRMGAVVDRLFEVAGGRSVFDGAGIQEIWRDIHIARAHVANNPTPFARNLGGMALGAENGDFFV
ncbi:MAG: flavin-dependent monooxygenase [Gammaproteobacteria bacterium]|nr:flavin-dependent monooxygenase [Gammaproteobacteria bacterium]